MDGISTPYPVFPFQPLHGEAIDTATWSAENSFFYATLHDTICCAEPLPADRLQAEEGRLVTWFRALQTLPVHANVLPYMDKLVTCPSAVTPGARDVFLIASGTATAITGSGLLDGQLLSLPVFLDKMKEKMSGTGAQLWLPEDTIRTVAMDVLCALHHLHLHGLVHRHVTPTAIRVNAETASSWLGDLGYSLDTFSGAAALNLRSADVVGDVYGLGHIVLTLIAGNTLVPVPPPGATTPASLRAAVAKLAGESAYSPELLDFAVACFTTAEDGKVGLEALLQHSFLRPTVVADVHRSRVQPQVPSYRVPLPHSEHHMQPQQPSALLPMPLTMNEVSDTGAPQSVSAPTSIDNSGIQLLTDALPQTTAGLSDGARHAPLSAPATASSTNPPGLFSPGSLHSRTRLVFPVKRGGGEVHVMHCGLELPKREQYYYITEGKQRHYLAGYGLLFELDVRKAVMLEDVYFATIGDVRSMHVQIFWRPGATFHDADAKAIASRDDGKQPWVPVLHRPKHLRKVMAHKPLSVGPFSLQLPFIDSHGDAGRNKHSFLLLTNYAHGVRFYGLPHGLLGYGLGAPLDADGAITIAAGLPCGLEVCTAVAGTLAPQAKPDTVGADESDDGDDEESDSGNVPKECGAAAVGVPATGMSRAAQDTAVSVALNRVLEKELAKPLDCPSGLFGGLKYTLMA